MIKVSAVIPIYGVAAFIERCARNLFSQTLREVEFIFVDDATPDNSIALLEKVIEEFPDRRARTRILHHPVNRGLPAARNTGLAAAQGEFIYHCDSDDWMETTMLEKLYLMTRRSTFKIQDVCNLIRITVEDMKSVAAMIF